MRIGFIGIGNMGTPMSINLLKAGYELTVHDIREEAMEAGVNLEVSRPSSPPPKPIEEELSFTFEGESSSMSALGAPYENASDKNNNNK